MWLRLLQKQNPRFSDASVRQYMTYHAMAKIPPAEAFRRATYQRAPLAPPRNKVVIHPNAIFNAVFRPPLTLQAVALAFQWSTGCRWSDLERLLCSHVSFPPSGDMMVVFYGGKTDLHHRGQALLLPSVGKYIPLLRAWIADRTAQCPEAPLFQGLTYKGYNDFLRVSVSALSHGIRRSALHKTADSAGQEAAQRLARHRSSASTEQYLPHHLWRSTQETRTATRLLQQ